MLRDRSISLEQMDSLSLSVEEYGLVLRELTEVNVLTRALRPTLNFLGRAVKTKQFRLLDVGFGHGDMLRGIALWAKQKGLEATLVGIDMNPQSAPVARAATPASTDIEFRSGDYCQVPEPFDFYISSLVAHHMTTAQLIAFLTFMQANARCGWFINDLHRHGAAFYGFSMLASLMRWRRIIREDGQLSVAKSFRPPEWEALLFASNITNARVFRAFPFRLCVEMIRTDSAKTR